MAELPDGVNRYRFQGGCGEHEENGLMLLNERLCDDGEWVRVSDLPAIEAAAVERAREALLPLLDQLKDSVIRHVEGVPGAGAERGRIEDKIHSDFTSQKGDGDRG